MTKKKLGKATSGLNDERFSRIKSDPMFSGLKNSEKKVVIDKRFAAALTDERFSTRAKVDMRGRKQKNVVGNKMLDLYKLEDDDDDDKKKSSKKQKSKTDVGKNDGDKELDEFFDENDDEDDGAESVDDADDEEEEEEVSDGEEEKVGINGFKRLDLARGEGNIDSSSDDDSSEDEEEQEEESADKTGGIELDLANLDRDVDQVEWTSNRLAVCNLEWDNMNCEDILMLVKSFIPPGGSVVSVAIYLSDLGKEQLEKEEKTGPLLKLAKPFEEYKEDEMDDETRTAVREYLVNKLKHYYAVVAFDSAASALAVYEECDGFQFEETGLKMDMRFIPDDTEFEEDRIKEFLKAEDVNLTKYKAKNKSKNAICSTGAKIAWDEDDPQRKKKFLEAFNEDDDAGKDLIVDSDESDDDQTNRNKLMALLNTDERKSKLNVDWDGEKKDDDGSDSSDGEYVKVDDDDEEIGVKQKNGKNESSGEEEEEEEKLSGYKAFKKKQKAKLMENKLKRKGVSGEAETNIKTVAAAETIANDDRFSALFTDSAFAIEPSSKKFKGSLLVSKQAEQKSKAPSVREVQSSSTKSEDLVQKLKKQADKWNKKKSSKN